MVYVDYKYYAEEYFGTLPENSFNSLVLKASREIDRNVNTRLSQEMIENLSEKAQEQLKYTACALTDLMAKKQEGENTSLSSISIDGVSKSFKVLSISEYKANRKDITLREPR